MLNSLDEQYKKLLRAVVSSGKEFGKFLDEVNSLSLRNTLLKIQTFPDKDLANKYNKEHKLVFISKAKEFLLN